jgi:hypothetical protein
VQREFIDNPGYAKRNNARIASARLSVSTFDPAKIDSLTFFGISDLSQRRAIFGNYLKVMLSMRSRAAGCGTSSPPMG